MKDEGKEYLVLINYINPETDAKGFILQIKFDHN